MSDEKINIDFLVSKINSFPTLPTIYYKISEVIDNPHSTANDVADVICQDQASASKVLRAANSPIYGFYGRIQNITQAISYIGFEEVKNLVIAMTIMDFFNKRFDNKYFNPVAFWQHSIGVGIMTRLIGKAIHAKDLESYFLTGIMHDLGKLLFLNTIPEEYNRVLKYSLENKTSFSDAETKIIGISHAVAGELLAEKWNLPPAIKYTIRYHNTGIVDNSYSEVVAATHVANIAGAMYGYGYSEDVIVEEPNKLAWEVLKLNDNFFTSSVELMTKSYHESTNLLLR
ncbi:MAG: HDOD domain-containing protein [Candidatus Kapabacteria bacterium]|nr:HDOD domain-containing protein [Ignavibacteriota bacterium]MCW5885736.1 HDOD domain-containing protein [Candidatus Kapabacteria bacterium]